MASMREAWLRYRFRLQRRRLLWRSLRSRHQLSCPSDRTQGLAPDAILAFATMRNEIQRLPHFLDHYRRLGVDHFLIVDNGSQDGSRELLADQPDVSLWETPASYKAARFGVDWLTWLQMRYGHGHWCLTVDADEILVYPHCDSRTLRMLTGWLEKQNRDALGALMLDMYPKGAFETAEYRAGDDPFAVLRWFDAGPFRAARQAPLQNLWVQGGARERAFFADNPQRSPTLNKLPLVRWNRRYCYINATHAILPRRLNAAYDGPGGDVPSGVLLHSKFLPGIVEKSKEEKTRRQHFRQPGDFDSYYDDLIANPDLWTQQSVAYRDWRQLEDLGLMSRGGWD